MRLVHAGVLAVVLLGSTLPVAASQAAPTAMIVSAPTGQLVFQRSRGLTDRDQWDIVAMAPHGSRVRVLTKNGFEPAASRDGRKVAFLRAAAGAPDATEVWVMDAAGRNQRLLASGLYSSPAWSADGARLFLAGQRSVTDGSTAIFAIRSDDLSTRRLTAWEGDCKAGLDASPNGKLLAFEVAECDRPQSGDIEAGDMQGHRVQLLQRWKPPAGSEYDWPRDPAWSPDGRRLAFSTIEGLFTGGLYSSQPDGSRPRRLVAVTLRASSPAWSRDGKWLALVRDSIRRYPGDIWLVRADGTVLRRLTNTKKIDERNITWLYSPAS